MDVLLKFNKNHIRVGKSVFVIKNMWGKTVSTFSTEVKTKAGNEFTLTIGTKDIVFEPSSLEHAHAKHGQNLQQGLLYYVYPSKKHYELHEEAIREYKAREEQLNLELQEKYRKLAEEAFNG
jgi:hypothetical protein